MPKRLRPIGHEDRLSVVDHLDELRSRLIVCFAVLIVAFGFCFWQNHRLLNLLNKPLPAGQHEHVQQAQRNHQRQRLDRQAPRARRPGADERRAVGCRTRSRGSALLANAAREITAAGKSLPQKSQTNVPITIGVGEPFTVSITVAFYAALLISLPVLLYELYAFVIPAMRPEEKHVARPILIVAPMLFLVGVVFTYIVVLPAAVKFLQGYNSNQFDAFVQAKPLYTFEVMTMGGDRARVRDAAVVAGRPRGGADGRAAP